MPQSNIVTDENTTENDSKVLIAFFSCSGNTAQMADYICEKTGGDMFDIVPKDSYTSEDLDYTNPDCRCAKEQSDPDARVDIINTVDNMEDYDTVYIGYPIWFGDAPKIIYTFMESYDFSQKTIVPFCTSGSTGIEKSVENISKLSPNAVFSHAKRFSPSALKSDVFKWIDDFS